MSCFNAIRHRPAQPPGQALVILAAALLACAVFRPAAAGERVRVRVGVHENAPLAFLDREGRPQGLCIDLLLYAAEREGWELEFVSLSRAEALSRLEKGEIDLLPGLARDDALAARFDFGRAAVFKTWLQVYVARGARAESAFDLAGRKIAVVRESAGEDQLRAELARYGVDCPLQEHDDYAAVLSAVSTGHADAGLVSRTYGISHGKSYDAYRAPVTIYLQEVHFAAPKGRGGPVLEALDRHVQALMAEKGSLYHRSLERWLSGGAGTPAWLYVLLCLIVPPFWAILTYFVFGALQKRWAARQGGPAVAEGARR